MSNEDMAETKTSNPSGEPKVPATALEDLPLSLTRSHSDSSSVSSKELAELKKLKHKDNTVIYAVGAGLAFMVVKGTLYTNKSVNDLRRDLHNRDEKWEASYNELGNRMSSIELANPPAQLHPSSHFAPIDKQVLLDMRNEVSDKPDRCAVLDQIISCLQHAPNQNQQLQSSLLDSNLNENQVSEFITKYGARMMDVIKTHLGPTLLRQLKAGDALTKHDVDLIKNEVKTAEQVDKLLELLTDEEKFHNFRKVLKERNEDYLEKMIDRFLYE